MVCFLVVILNLFQDLRLYKISTVILNTSEGSTYHESKKGILRVAQDDRLLSSSYGDAETSSA